MTDAYTSVTRRDVLLLTGVVLLLLVGAAAFIATPGYMDADYYYAGGLRLYGGYGFTEPYLWNYLSGLTALPIPSHIYWMPLPSILAAASMTLFGAGFRAAQIPFVLIAAALPALAYYLAQQFDAPRRVRLVAGLLAGLGGFYFVRWPTTDGFGLYALVGTLFFLTLARALTIDNGTRWFLAAGLFSGLAHLTRADGLLFVGVGGLMVLWAAGGRRGWRWASGAIVALLLGYALLMGPWLARNLNLLGTPLAPGGAQAAFLTEYNDLFNYPNNLTLTRYLAQGWATIVRQKLQALAQNLVSVWAVQGLVFLLPFIVVGAWRWRRHPLVQAVLLYELVLLAVMSFVFPFQGVRGGFFHSGAAVYPAFVVLGVLGLDATVDWVAAHRPSWEPDKAKPVFSLMLVGMAVLLTGLLALRALPDWNAELPVYAEVGDWLASNAPDAILATNNPPGWYANTGHTGVFIPASMQSLRAAVDEFDIDIVLLSTAHPLAPLLAEQAAPPLVEAARFELFGTGNYLLVLEVAR